MLWHVSEHNLPSWDITMYNCFDSRTCCITNSVAQEPEGSSLTTARHRSLSRASWIQSTPQGNLPKIHSDPIHPCLGLPSSLFPSDFPTKTLKFLLDVCVRAPVPWDQLIPPHPCWSHDPIMTCGWLNTIDHFRNSCCCRVKALSQGSTGVYMIFAYRGQHVQ
jgi:hypothetical protein